MPEPLDEPLGVVAADELADDRSRCSRVSKRCRERHCSFSVRMKRSATPLHSGSPTYEGEMAMPSHFTSLIQASAMYCGPQSQRIFNPRAISLPKAPKAWRTPWRSH